MSAVHYVAAGAAALLLGVSTPTAADDWQRTMAMYLLAAGLDGESQLGPVTTDIDQSFSDLLENLEYGVMGSFQVRNEQWAHTLDAMYVGLKGDTTGASGVRFQAEVDQLIASYDIAYLLNPRLEILAGARYNALDVNLEVRGPTDTASAGRDKDWVDPYVGLRSTLPLSESLSLTLRGDIGGFDVGSKLAWQAVVRLNYWFYDNFGAMLGYRILDTDYEDGSGAGTFRYDATMSGPVLGFAWRF